MMMMIMMTTTMMMMMVIMMMMMVIIMMMMMIVIMMMMMMMMMMMIRYCDNSICNTFFVVLQKINLRLVVDSFVIKAECSVTSINADRDWAHSGYSRLKGRFVSFPDVGETLKLNYCF